MADREQEQGVPLQLLHKIVQVDGFDVDTWKHSGRKPNEVRVLPGWGLPGWEWHMAMGAC